MSTPNRRGGRKRPWLAALLTILVPGLGHAYLRMWARALFWLLVTVAAWGLLVPDFFTAGTPSEIFAATDEASVSANLLLASVAALCVVDAYLMALSFNAEPTESTTTETTTCPHCGNELDEDLDFCHWCTTPIDNGDSEEEQ